MGISASYTAASGRYDHASTLYRRCGRSGILLPKLSLGFWHNFGSDDPYERSRSITHYAFDHGITHFDLANNYGPPYGTAEQTMGRLMQQDFRPYRDELFISTKAGYDMWEGPYGNFGSRKYLISSIDQSLKRMHVDYVDVFYHHRPDPETPIEETMGALDQIVRSGKALYVGISNYDAEQTREAVRVLKELGTPGLIHQPSYSLLNRRIENNGVLATLRAENVGCICFAPLANGLLTGKYLHGIPADSRAARDPRYLKADNITQEQLQKIARLNEIAIRRGQSLTQMALSWVLRDPVVTSALIGASKPEQILENVKAIENLTFTEEELHEIDAILA